MHCNQFLEIRKHTTTERIFEKLLEGMNEFLCLKQHFLRHQQSQIQEVLYQNIQMEVKIMGSGQLEDNSKCADNKILKAKGT